MTSDGEHQTPQPSSLSPARHSLVGHFACDTQTKPEYDPPHGGPCLVCWQPLSPDDVRTISLMPLERAVASAFFRVHRTCAESDPQAVEAIEHRIIEGPSFPLWEGEVRRPQRSQMMTDAAETAAIHTREAEVYEFVQSLRNNGCAEPALSVAAINYRGILTERDRWRDRLQEVFARDNPGGFWNDLNSDIEQDAETGRLRFKA